MTGALVLAGDVGGTNARFALAHDGPDGIVFDVQETYPVPGSDSLATLVQRFLTEHPAPVAHAALGVAAPIVDGRARPINLPWAVDERELGAVNGFTEARLLNDLEANAWGLGELTPDQLHVLQPDGLEGGGPKVVVSAGTGLGVAAVIRAGGRPVVLPSEGGHCDFGPRDTTEDALLLHLRARYPEWGHVSSERVVSGRGIVAIWEFIRESGRAEAGEDLLEATRGDDAGPAITAAALAESDPSAVLALETFVRAYGAAAGNLALILFATGGVYLGGGIAPRILPLLEAGSFLDAFHAKGRYDHLLERIGVSVILDDLCALRGAARRALALAEDSP
jgi:glucokinase